MAKNLDAVLVIDIECTCWHGETPPGENNEIIEIGVCTLSLATLERTAREAILVRPERSRVSAFCTELTTLTQAQVDGGVSFREACARLKRHYKSKERLWASYGDYDRLQFERQCGETAIPFPFGPTHLNVKNLLAMSLALPHEIGMDAALPELALPLEGTHHRGVDDAWNIAALLARILRSARTGVRAA